MIENVLEERGMSVGWVAKGGGGGGIVTRLCNRKNKQKRYRFRLERVDKVSGCCAE